MKKFKIPVRVEATAFIDIIAKDLNDACLKAMGKSTTKSYGLVIADDIFLPEVDEKELKKMYPKEYNKMKEDEKPYWEKMGWVECGVDIWVKGDAKIENTFYYVGWGFNGTVWIGDTGKSGFNSLKEAIDYAEANM